MPIDEIKGLQIEHINEDVLLVKQKKPPFYFSCCDGVILLPKKGRNNKLIALDVNIESEYIHAISEYYGKISFYINTHGHMDHIAHVHAWENEGAEILAPESEANNLLGLNHFYRCYDFNEGVNFSSIEKFGEINRYKPCKNVYPFSPGEELKLENLILKTIPLTGHSKSHIGFLLSQEKILHISCLGFDILTPESNGFGPWYGFKQCSIEQYKKDIDLVEKLYLKKAEYLTSSHAYIVEKPEMTPFGYMRNKIKNNQNIIKNALKELDKTLSIDNKTQKLVEKDLFFPKRKMEGFLKEIYTFWEYWIIKNHLLFRD